MQSTTYSCHILTKLEICRQIFKEYSHIKFHENPFCGNRVVPYGRTDRRTETDMTKLINAFRNYGNAPKDIRG